MQVSVAFQDEQLALEFPGDSLVGSWSGPPGVGSLDAAAAVRNALEQPWQFPPVRQLVVSGDRVAIALDGSLSSSGVAPRFASSGRSSENPGSRPGT